MGEQGFIYGLVGLLLASFGIVLPVSAFVGGMGMALGCCFAVMAMRPLEKRRAVPLTLFMGALAGIIAAMLHGTTGGIWLWGSLPVQAQMGAAGAFSQIVFEFVAARGRQGLDELARRAGLPGAEGE